MNRTNAEIAAQLGQLAELLRSQGGNRFKIKAYLNASDAIRRHPLKLGELVARGQPFPRIAGVGPGIGAAIQEIVQSGSLGSVRRLGESLPPGTAAIAEAAGISVREAQRLAKALDVRTPDALREKLRSGELAAAVGLRLEHKVRHGLEDVRRLLWDDAGDLAQHFQEVLTAVKGVTKVDHAGSFRRGKQTVGTLRFVVETRSPATLRSLLREHGGVESVREEGKSHVVCKLAAGPLLRVRFAAATAWGTALVEETGSDGHLDEVARSVEAPPAAAFSTEHGWYAARKLPWIPPELREGRGEVAAALKGELPDLVELAQIRGDLHTHTTASDGANTLQEMVAAAQARGYSYVAVTDHSKSLRITNGLDEKRLREQMAAIDELNSSLRAFRVLKGSEVDILEDGSLDFGGEILRDLDIVIGSIHSRFGLDREQQTHRMLRAVDNPWLTCVGHLTGRKLLKRPGYELGLDVVLQAVKRQGKLLEINASPDRLDIDDAIALRARQLGIPLLVNTDAHSVRDFDYMAFGVRQARRGWQSGETIVNTLPLPALLRRLRATRRHVRPA